MDLARVAARVGVGAELGGGAGSVVVDGDADAVTDGETERATATPGLPEHAVAPMVTVTNSVAAITTLGRARRALLLTRWFRTW